MLDTLGLNFHVHLANIFDSVVQRTFLARKFFTIKSCTNLSQVSKTSKMYTSKCHKVNNMILFSLKILRHQNIFLVSKKKSHENYKPISFFFDFSFLYSLHWHIYRGWNNDRLTEMTSQILPFVPPEFSVIMKMTSHFFS